MSENSRLIETFHDKNINSAVRNNNHRCYAANKKASKRIKENEKL